MTDKKTQTELVLNHLATHGYITPLIAGKYGVERLAARIYDIERAGNLVNRETRRDDLGKRYTYYTLAA